MRKLIAVLVSVLFFFGMPPVSHSQGHVKVTAFSSVSQVPPGSSFRIALKVEVQPGFHINSNEPLDEIYIPTEVTFDPVEGVSFGRVYYPEGEVKSFAFSETPLSIYEGEVTIFADVELSDQLQPGLLELTGKLHYQACNDQNCFLPADAPFSVQVKVVPAGSPRIEANEAIFSGFQPYEASPGKGMPSGEQVRFTRDERRAKEIIERGFIYALAAFFVFGLALNLTPCVYPVIPITVSYFGSREGESRATAFVNALFYVLGIAIVFSLLGLISGLAGRQWGFLFQNPWFVIGITVIILAMAASMFGAFEITVPSWIMNRFGTAREGTVGAFIMGLTVGVVIAPCAAGIIIGLVGLVAKLGIVVKGTILFFIMGLGLGLPYLILATFSSLLSKLPQSGMWMVWVKKFFGLLLVGVAIYFFLPQASHIHDQLGFYMGTLAIFGGLLLGFLDHAPGYTPAFKRFRAVFGILIILIGVFLANRAIHSRPSAIDWKHYAGESIQQLTAEGKPVFFDFYADWCAPCKEMDATTFRDEYVVELSRRFTMVKVDCTSPDEVTRRFMEKFQVTGMPTLIFLRPDGSEIQELREVGYVGPADFARMMEKALEEAKAK